MSIEKILTPKEVSEILQIGYRSVLNLIRDNKIKSFKINNKYRVTELDLENYILEAKTNNGFRG